MIDCYQTCMLAAYPMAADSFDLEELVHVEQTYPPLFNLMFSKVPSDDARLVYQTH